MTDNEKFIKRYTPTAIFEGLRSGVLPSVTLSQAIIESGWGRSELAQKPYYNFFGIKAHGNPNYVEFPTREFINGQYVTINSKFRDYRSAKESFKDHSDFLKTYPNYNGVFDADDYTGQTQALQNGGYATSPIYAYTLQNTIETYNLDKYDYIVKYRKIIIIITVIIVAFIIYLLIKRHSKKWRD